MNEYIHPNNSKINLLKKYDHVFFVESKTNKSWSSNKNSISSSIGQRYSKWFKSRDKLVVLFGSNRALRGWHPRHNLYSERVKTIRWFERNAPNDFALYGKNGICQEEFQLASVQLFIVLKKNYF